MKPNHLRNKSVRNRNHGKINRRGSCCPPFWCVFACFVPENRFFRSSACNTSQKTTVYDVMDSCYWKNISSKRFRVCVRNIPRTIPFYESYRMEVRITLFTKRMTGYAFDIRGQATINVINSMPCAPNKKVDAGSSNFLWKPLLKDEKTIHKMNDFKYQISCVWHISSLLINICVKRWEFQNLVLYNYILIESKFYYKFSWRSKTAKKPREYFLENSSC